MKEGTLNRGFMVNKLTFVFLFFIESIGRFVMYLLRLLPLYNSCVQYIFYLSYQNFCSHSGG